MFAIQTTFQGRSFYYYKGQDFLPGVDSARKFSRRSQAVGLVEQRFQGARVVPVETMPALYRVRRGDSLYLAGSLDSHYFQAGKVDSLKLTREQALALARDLGGVAVPAV